jgi:hypothetical protein
VRHPWYRLLVVVPVVLALLLPAAVASAEGESPIELRWQALGGEAGVLGAPVAEEYDVPGGRARDFAGGRVYLAAGAAEAWEVLPPVLQLYLDTGGPAGALGLPTAAAAALGPPASPTAPVTAPAPGTPEPLAQVFTAGRVYWSAATGPHALTGPVLARYLQIGGPASYLGLPTSELTAVADGFRATFVGGRVDQTAAGATVVTGRWLPSVRRVSAASLPYTYRAGCPVRPASLRLVRMPYYDWNDVPRLGDLVVRASAVGAMQRVFRRAFDARFPIRKMRPVDVYRGNDVVSMAADNTSAFNCRKVTGNPYRLSQHSYGNAIDINTVENPYVTRSRVYPSTGRAFLARAKVRKGMITRSSPIARAMAAERWLWGARWSHPDYQHFSANGG